MTDMKKEIDINENIKFEEAFEMLERITQELEKGDSTLEESIELFEKGTRLSDICYKKLNDAKQKITLITHE